MSKCLNCGYMRQAEDESAFTECPQCHTIHEKVEILSLEKEYEEAEKWFIEKEKKKRSLGEDRQSREQNVPDPLTSSSMKNCPYCSEEIKPDAVKCRYCGEWLNQPTDKPNISPEKNNLEIAEDIGSTIAKEYLGSLKYAGFGIRFGSGLIDFIILLIPSTLAIALEREVLGEFGGLIFLTIVWWLYYALLESSERQASIGKKALGLIVIDSEGRKITFWRASGRFFISLISALIYGIGYIMIAFNKKKQGLHDWMTDTFVLKKDPSSQCQESSENIMNFVQSTKLAPQKVTYGKNVKRPLIVGGSIVVILIIIGIISGLMEQQNQRIVQEKSQRLHAEQQRNAIIAADQARIKAEQQRSDFSEEYMREYRKKMINGMLYRDPLDTGLQTKQNNQPATREDVEDIVKSQIRKDRILDGRPPF